MPLNGTISPMNMSIEMKLSTRQINIPGIVTIRADVFLVARNLPN